MAYYQRSTIIWAAAVILFASLIFLVLPVVREHEQSKRLQGAAAQINAELQRFAAEHNGLYPLSAQELIDHGYLGSWPQSPYGGALTLLDKSAAPVAGGFVYVPIGQMVNVPPAAASGNQILPQKVYDYYLVIYGDRVDGIYAAAAQQAQAFSPEHGADLSTLASLSAGIDPAVFSSVNGVDWGRVALISQGSNTAPGGGGGSHSSNGCG